MGWPLSTCLVNRLTTFTPQVFLRRLHLTLPLTVRNCHLCTCRGARWQRNVVARIREAGGGPQTCWCVTWTVGPDVGDNSRLEVVADGVACPIGDRHDSGQCIAC